MRDQQEDVPEVGDQPRDVVVLEGDHLDTPGEPAQHAQTGPAECEVVRLAAGDHHGAGQVESQAVDRAGRGA